MSYILNNPSHEQKNVLLNLKYNNVVCDSVAGSGKTTTILYIAKTFKSKSILLLTYNAKLKIETREKVKLLNLTNIEVHSYHSFCVKY
jgi:superfamily I DNA/RNA helicase